MTEKLTITLDAKQSEAIEKFRAAARLSKKEEVAERATSVISSVAFLLDFAIDEQIRRFDKAKSDALARKVAEAKAAYSDVLAEAIKSGDFEKAQALITEREAATATK